jgi:hypothetical protein
MSNRDLDALRAAFWAAPPEALFPSPYVAAVRHVSIALLERERWQSTGPRYIKLGARVLYRKSAVLEWIRRQEEAA